MQRNWIEYGEGLRRAGPNEIYASINHRGEILFNRLAYEQMEQPESVLVLFDPDHDTIGIKPATPQIMNAVPVRTRGVSGHRVISVNGFLKKHDIQIEGTDRFRTAAIENGILVLDLRYRRKAVGTPRPGRRKLK